MGENRGFPYFSVWSLKYTCVVRRHGDRRRSIPLLMKIRSTAIVLTTLLMVGLAVFMFKGQPDQTEENAPQESPRSSKKLVKKGEIPLSHDGRTRAIPRRYKAPQVTEKRVLPPEEVKGIEKEIWTLEEDVRMGMAEVRVKAGKDMELYRKLHSKWMTDNRETMARLHELRRKRGGK